MYRNSRLRRQQQSKLSSIDKSNSSTHCIIFSFFGRKIHLWTWFVVYFNIDDIDQNVTIRLKYFKQLNWSLFIAFHKRNQGVKQRVPMKPSPYNATSVTSGGNWATEDEFEEFRSKQSEDPFVCDSLRSLVTILLILSTILLELGFGTNSTFRNPENSCGENRLF